MAASTFAEVFMEERGKAFEIKYQQNIDSEVKIFKDNSKGENKNFEVFDIVISDKTTLSFTWICVDDRFSINECLTE